MIIVAGYFPGVSIPGALIELDTCVEILARDAKVLVYDTAIESCILYQYPMSPSKTDCCYLV